MTGSINTRFTIWRNCIMTERLFCGGLERQTTQEDDDDFEFTFARAPEKA